MRPDTNRTARLEARIAPEGQFRPIENVFVRIGVDHGHVRAELGEFRRENRRRRGFSGPALWRAKRDDGHEPSRILWLPGSFLVPQN